MPITYDIETDYFYKKGIEKGMSAKDHELKYHFVVSLLENTDFDDNKIALIAGVEFDFVAKIRESLIKKSDAANQ
ncbi:MAG: hypothetical protein JNL70_00860 [Saprospiraceae bacterium]|nr:hypothetical protein [Saprospiraceae bacterium]